MDTRFRASIRAGHILMFGFGLAVTVVACGSDNGVAPTTSNATAISEQLTVDSNIPQEIPGQIQPASNMDGDPESLRAAPPTGTCANLIGTASHVEFQQADCAGATFKVIQIADLPRSCSPDVDQKYFHGDPVSGVTYTLCLDINWSTVRCIETYRDPNIPWATIDCGMKSPSAEGEIIRPVGMVVGTFDSSACESQMSFSYVVREFVVCAEQVD